MAQTWTIDDVVEWAVGLNPVFSKYEASFREMGLDGEMLLECDDDILKDELGVSSGLHRKKLLKAIAQLQEEKSGGTKRKGAPKSKPMPKAAKVKEVKQEDEDDDEDEEEEEEDDSDGGDDDIKVLKGANGNYKLYDVDKNQSIQAFVEDHGLVWARGSGYYQVGKKKENISKAKKIVLVPQSGKGAIVDDPTAARKALGLAVGAAHKINATVSDKYNVFVQSTSNNRGLKAGAQFLYVA